MIVLEEENSYYIIQQRYHALLASKLIINLADIINLTSFELTELLVASATHDDGFTYTDTSYYVTESGKPKDFRTMGFEKKATLQILNNAKLRSVWNYLFSLSHIQTLYSNTDEKEILEFLKYTQKEKKTYLNANNISEDRLNKLYSYLKWSDECSLQLCFSLLDQSSKLEIHGFYQIDSFNLCKENHLWTIQPFPFISNPFVVFIEFKKIPKDVYKNDFQLFKSINNAPVQKYKVEFRNIKLKTLNN